MIISDPGRRRRSWGSRTGRAGTSRQHIDRSPTAWPTCRRPGTSRTPSAAPSSLPTSGSRRVVSTTRCAPMSRRCSLRRHRASPCCEGPPDIYVGLSELHREHDDLDGATQDLLHEPGAGGAHRLAAEQVPLVRCHGAGQGGPGRSGRRSASCSSRRSASYVRNHFFPDVRPTGAVKARLWVVQGRLAEAAGWAREQGLSAADDLTYVREFEHITLARLLLAQATRERAEPGVGEALDAAAAPPGRRGRRRADGDRDRDPGPPGARPARRRRHGGCPGVAGTRADAGGAGGLRPSLHRRGAAHGGTAEAGGEATQRLRIRAPPPCRCRHDGGADARRAATHRAAQRAGARGPAPPGERSRRPGHRARAHRCRWPPCGRTPGTSTPSSA